MPVHSTKQPIIFSLFFSLLFFLLLLCFSFFSQLSLPLCLLLLFLPCFLLFSQVPEYEFDGRYSKTRATTINLEHQFYRFGVSPTGTHAPETQHHLERLGCMPYGRSSMNGANNSPQPLRKTFPTTAESPSASASAGAGAAVASGPKRTAFQTWQKKKTPQPEEAGQYGNRASGAPIGSEAVSTLEPGNGSMSLARMKILEETRNPPKTNPRPYVNLQHGLKVRPTDKSHLWVETSASASKRKVLYVFIDILPRCPLHRIHLSTLVQCGTPHLHIRRPLKLNHNFPLLSPNQYY